MVVEHDAVHIEGFAFVPIRAVVNIDYPDSTTGKSSSETRRVRGCVDCFNGKQLTDDGKAFALPCAFVFVSAVIDTAQVNQKLEMQTLVVAQCVAAEI